MNDEERIQGNEDDPLVDFEANAQNFVDEVNSIELGGIMIYARNITKEPLTARMRFKEDADVNEVDEMPFTKSRVQASKEKDFMNRIRVNLAALSENARDIALRSLDDIASRNNGRIDNTTRQDGRIENSYTVQVDFLFKKVSE